MVRTGIPRLRPIMSHPHNHAGTIANNHKKGQSWDDWPKLGNLCGLSRNCISGKNEWKHCLGLKDPMITPFLWDPPNDRSRPVFVAVMKARDFPVVGKNPCVFFTACAVTFFIRHVSSHCLEFSYALELTDLVLYHLYEFCAKAFAVYTREAKTPYSLAMFFGAIAFVYLKAIVWIFFGKLFHQAVALHFCRN